MCERGVCVWGGGGGVNLGIGGVSVWTLNVGPDTSFLEILENAFWRILRIRNINLAFMEFERLLLN